MSVNAAMAGRAALGYTMSNLHREFSMRSAPRTGRMSRSLIIAAFVASAASSLHAQAQAAPPLSRADLEAFAKVYIAVSQVRDSINLLLAQSRNKTKDMQQQLQTALGAKIAEILHHNGVTEAEYQRKTYLLSSEIDLRKSFDSVVAKITGVPTPGQAPPAAAGGRGAPVPVPAGAVGTHIGHVVNQFGDTPDGMGFLPTALAEARIAAQHATLGSRDPNNLTGMQTHAGHVIHALDPTIITMGPGRGYGVKKAAAGVASHIELAAKAQGASQNVITHAAHIATAARTSIEKADEIIALAEKVRTATSAAEAAALMNQIVSLTNQLIAGVDTNADGQIGWDKPEGALQQAQEHVTRMLAAEQR